MRLIHVIGYLAFALGSTLPLYGCDSDGDSEPPPTSQEPEPEPEEQADPTANTSAIHYNNMAVHDPSVIRTDSDTYYVFGSHLAAAKSTDLMTWERVANEVNDENPLFNTYATEISEGLEWVGGHQGSWAADVIQLGDGRYYFYYNHCANPESEAGDCNAPRSYLGVAVSENVEGPYTDLGTFMRSGMTPEEIEAGYGPEGIGSYDPTIHPNAIDPDVFYDKDGKLWMTYGSYSGGIFILEMDEETAMPKPGQGFGKHLAGGNHSAIEGTYMLYSPESDYYYLFMSFGGYVSTDGYNMRIARSKTPDGPFLDAEGKNMAEASGNWASIEPYGAKLMGGFQFESEAGDPAAPRGYLAPGHNSAYYDEETGKHLLFFHTRFPNRGEQHAIRVHELFVNADNWLVASPHRYAPIEGDNIVDGFDVRGNYKFINHGKDINRKAKESLYITLGADGSISGDLSGSYRLYADDARRIDFTLDIDGESKNYRGVMQWQWNSAAGELVPVFSALNNTGESIWGTRMGQRNTPQILADIAADLPGALPGVVKDGPLNLPENGTYRANIDWSSSDESVISGAGHLWRPRVGRGDADVTLTADITLDGQTQSQAVTLRVPQRLPHNRSAHFAFEDDLTESLGRFSAGSATTDRITDENGSVAFSAGQVGQALELNGTNGVSLPDGLIDNYEYTVSFWANPAAVTQFTTGFFAAVDEFTNNSGAVESNRWVSFLPHSWDGNTMLWSNNDGSWFDGSAGEIIPTDTWTHMAFAVRQGQVRIYLNGVEKFSGSGFADFFTKKIGKFSLGVNYWNTPYSGQIDELKVYDSALSAEEIRNLDIDPKSTVVLLASAVRQLDLGITGGVNHDLFLPASGAYASAIQWDSSHPAIISETGEVTLPGSDTEVTLTATLSLDGEQQSKTFQVLVVDSPLPQPIANYSFEQNLNDSTGTFAAGSTTGIRVGEPGGNITYGEGVVGQAAVFDGASGVHLPDNLINDHRYSFSLWLSPEALTSHTSGFFGYATDDSWISLLPGGFGEDVVLWSGTAWYDGLTGVKLATKTWTHLATTVDNGEVQVYINGEQAHNGSGFPDVFSSAEATIFSLGINYRDTPYTGMMDEVKVYAEPLTAEEVLGLYEEELLGE